MPHTNCINTDGHEFSEPIPGYEKDGDYQSLFFAISCSKCGEIRTHRPDTKERIK